MRTRTCPQCGYVLHRDNHPLLGVVKFCRRSCIRQWLYRHGKTAEVWRDDLEIERRRG